MNEGLSLLVTLMVMTLRGQPIPHAKVQCAEISRMTDEKEWEESPEEDDAGAVLVTDSQGHMVLVYYPGTLHCAAWAKGYKRRYLIIDVTDRKKVPFVLLPE